MAGKAYSSDDCRWMEIALSLAIRGEGLTRPNPPVGAVVVSRGSIVGRAYHKRAGAAHAEIGALLEAGRRARGGTLYVTLEPCCTFGRTPPCTDAILEAGISRVVVSVRDPNPKHAGRGLRLLRKAGLETVCGVCRSDGALLIAPFAKWIITGRPYVTLKMGMTLDGRIADMNGDSKWITCAASRKVVQNLRRGSDAVIVGAGTVRTDNPSLLCLSRKNRGPIRVIVDSTGSVPLSSRIFSDGYAWKTLLATTARCSCRKRKMLEAEGVTVWDVSTRGGKKVSLTRLMSRLGKSGLLHVLCEGGSEIAAELIRTRCVDEYRFFVAPRLLGGRKSLPVVTGVGWALQRAPQLRFSDVQRIGRDIMITALPG